jgi:hypothetical protein
VETLNRRNFLQFGASALAATTSAAPTGHKRFYITGLAHTKTLNDCTIPPIEVHAPDRVSAIYELIKYATVWTEDEWNDVSGGGHMFGSDMCKQAKAGDKP